MIFSFVSGWPLGLQILTIIVGLGVGVFCLVKFCDIFVNSASAITQMDI